MKTMEKEEKWKTKLKSVGVRERKSWWRLRDFSERKSSRGIQCEGKGESVLDMSTWRWKARCNAVPLEASANLLGGSEYQMTFKSYCNLGYEGWGKVSRGKVILWLW